MNGKDFVAVVALYSKADALVAAVGQTCERVDPQSLGWLLEDGLIQPVPQKPVPTVSPVVSAPETAPKGDA